MIHHNASELYLQIGRSLHVNTVKKSSWIKSEESTRTDFGQVIGHFQNQHARTRPGMHRQDAIALPEVFFELTLVSCTWRPVTQWLNADGDMLEELDMIFWINMDKLGSSDTGVAWCSYLIASPRSHRDPAPTAPTDSSESRPLQYL